jgi:hypothetical protein
LIKRLPANFIRHILSEFRTQNICANEAARELGVCRARLYQLYTDYLASGANRNKSWSPGLSGGDHARSWPIEATDLLRKLLSSKPPCPYSAAASELFRRCHFKTDRASVRRWAIENNLAPDTRFKTQPKPVRRWQVRNLGALWQYDASPHLWLPCQKQKHVMLNILDDATRFNTGARLYYAENLLTHMDFLSRVFLTHGLPLALYVDYHSIFFTNTPEAFTQLGAALHFYGVALRFAPTPQAKGKIERRHDYWQKRLPALMAADQIVELDSANRLIDKLLAHANANEIHRELGTTPQQAWGTALEESRSSLRPPVACSWWPYVWSQQSKVRVGDDGKVPAGSQRLKVEAAPRSTVVRCLCPNGDIFFLKDPPNPKNKPIVLLHCPPF